MDPAMTSAMRRAGSMITAWKSLQISFTVMSIRPSGLVVLVETDAGFGGLERFLEAPPPSGDRDEVVQGNGFG
jgi:hypothetical protein